MAKREPLFEADLGDNGGFLQIWDETDLEGFIARESQYWSVLDGGERAQPFGVVAQQLDHLSNGLRAAASAGDRSSGSSLLTEVYGNSNIRIPLSTSQAAAGIQHVYESHGRTAAMGALSIALPTQLWGDGIGSGPRPYWRGLIEQVLHETGLTGPSIEAARRVMNGLNGRATQIMAGIESRANEQADAAKIDFENTLKHQEGRNGELERQRLVSLSQFQQQATDVVARLEGTHNAYLEQMKLKAPVEYWRTKAGEHKTAAAELRNWLAGFFALMIGGYAIAFAALHQQIASFLLQFQGSTGALLVISAAFALLASLPLWVGRLLVKFYLSEHHLATDAKEREVMTQTYLALTADGAVDEKDRSLILAALFRSTPDGVVKDSSQPDTSPAAMLSKLLDSR